MSHIGHLLDLNGGIGLGDLFVIAMNFELVQNAIMAGEATGWFCGMRKWVAAASAPRSSASAPTHCTDWSQVGAAARFGLTNTSTAAIGFGTQSILSRGQIHSNLPKPSVWCGLSGSQLASLEPLIIMVGLSFGIRMCKFSLIPSLALSQSPRIRC